MTDTLQTAAAAPAVDPNTMLAVTPDTSTTGDISKIAKEKETFSDEWAKAPTADGTVRTWIDPSKRETPEGEFLSAWYDQPAAQPQAPAFDPAANAAAIQQATAAQAPPPAAATAAPAQPAVPRHYEPSVGGYISPSEPGVVYLDFEGKQHKFNYATESGA